jgi:signal transduction histidine kinase
VPPPDLPAAAPGGTTQAPDLAAAVLAATSRSHLEATLHDIVRAAVQHVDARYGAMGVLNPDGRRLDRVVTAGEGAGEREGVTSRPGNESLVRLLAEEPPRPAGDDDGPADSGTAPTLPYLRVPVRVGDSVFGNLYLTDKRTGGFTTADIQVARALAAVAGLAIENARLAESAGTAQRWGQAATELATALLSGADPQDLLRSLCERVQALTAADQVGALSPSLDDGDSLTVVAAAGPGAEDVEGVRIPRVGTNVGDAYRDGAARLFDDISRVPVLGRRSTIATEFSERFGPGLIVPLGRGNPVAILVAARVLGREPFEAEDLALISGFAAQAAVVLELARAQQRERMLQMQADRDRIARDLHDHVVQRIFATALSLDRLGRSLAATQPDTAERLSSSVDDLERTITEIRATIFELHQEDGEPATSLRRQLTDLVRQITEDSGLRRDVRTRGRVNELPRELVPDLLAVVRELVTNVVRHAGASRVTLTVSVEDELRVVVADDGTGLRPGTVRSGLTNLSARAERRGGRLTAAGSRRGTHVSWTVPLPR